MDADEYRKMAAVEDAMWWYRGLRANLQTLAGVARPGEALLDAGCGTGGTLRHLSAVAPGVRLYGMDYDREACALARTKCACPIAAGSIDALPFSIPFFGVFLCAYSLCHLTVDRSAS